ncbi:MAG: bifunctional 5,10-methylene-tetrahydrofolate dehydrogenase/5,10-methylene-tetrahydrofolate cyclohydrolase [Verrucomicrobiae bacterium]|nr:bifunctional 5,10-methylene-tetrahydrofolate dehydrogenase/5,10-methylene-tetrahydrofolate cyclohydrolase [Verrucomicrobiae bacterium]
MHNLIDGRALAAGIHEETRVRVEALVRRGITPQLVFLRIGEDPASKVYVGMKEQTCSRLGIRSTTIVLPDTTPQADLLDRIRLLNADPAVHGILIQAPLPPSIDAPAVFARVDPAKDVDGFHPVNMGRLLLGDPGGFVPCTPGGVHEMLIRSGIPIEGREVVVLGRGNIVGKPMAAILLQKARHADATVTVCHSRTPRIAEHCRRADILIAALGSPHFVSADMVKPGATVIDVGVNRIPDPSAKGGSRLVGDVDFPAVQPVAGRITPNPGGVGPMTIAMLMRNTLHAAAASLGMEWHPRRPA